MKLENRELASALIYFCAQKNNWILPANEKVFLTAIVRGLADIAEIYYVEIAPYSDTAGDRLSEDGQFYVSCGEYRWVNDIKDYLSKSTIFFEQSAPETVSNFWNCVREVLNLKFAKNEYANVLMGVFAEIKRRGISDGFFKVVFPQEEIVKIEESVIPKLAKLSLGTEYLLGVLAEKTVGHF